MRDGVQLYAVLFRPDSGEWPSVTYAICSQRSAKSPASLALSGLLCLFIPARKRPQEDEQDAPTQEEEEETSRPGKQRASVAVKSEEKEEDETPRRAGRASAAIRVLIPGSRR